MRNRLAFPPLTPAGGPIHFRVLEGEDVFTPLGAYGSLAAGLLCSGGRRRRILFLRPTTTSHHVFCLVLIVSNPLSSISLICPRGERKRKRKKEGGAIEPRSTGLRRTRRDRSRPA